MKRRPLLRILLLLLVTCGLSFAAPRRGWSAGFAKADITPRQSMWLAGYAARTKPSEGTIHPLWLKVLALEDAHGHKVVFLASDLLGLPRPIAETIRREAGRRYGVKRNNLMLTSSHTHSGPVLEGALANCYPLTEGDLQPIKEYSRSLEKTAVETIGIALSSLRPALLRAGQGETGFAANRRNNQEQEAAERLEAGLPLAGPVDHTVPVLGLQDESGKTVGIVFGYACHNTTLNSYSWCGDYAGFAQIGLEKRFPGAMAFFYSGCGADQNPIPRRSLELCEKYGEMLTTAVAEVLNRPMKTLEPEIRTAFTVVNLPFDGKLSRTKLQAAAKLSKIHERWANQLLKELDAGRKFPDSYPYPVQAWRLGKDQLWVALGGEVVVDYALSFKRMFGPATWVTGYANDVMAYIPSRRVWDEGGYEQGAMYVYGLPAERWDPSIEDRITKAVRRLGRKVTR
jgi:neutral ceramidase